LATDTTAVSPSCVSDNSSVRHSEKQTNNHDGGPTELYCPISHELMTKDPVIAADGLTYERAAIENWFRMKIHDMEEAMKRLNTNNNLQREKEIVRHGITSPIHNTKVANITLVPNTNIKQMARDFARKNA